MRHRYAHRHLGRTSSHRRSLFRNLAVNLCCHNTIRTTLPKAKELRRFIEPLITRAKVDTCHNKRLIFARLRNREAMLKLFNELGPHFKERPGGYLRILKCAHRSGDQAPMAIVQFVDYGEKLEDVETS